MSNVSPAYASKLSIASSLARLGARAVTISAVARTKPSDSRETHKREQGFHSQSGQTPTDHRWFLANQKRRQHAAFLLIMFSKIRASIADNPDALGLAFTMTYADYLRLYPGGEGAEISMERFTLLTNRGYPFGWKNIIKGESSKFGSDDVRVMNCRKCKIPHLVEIHYRSYECGCNSK